MYCRMCGNKLEDTDHYCQHCGTPTGYREQSAASADGTETKEEIIFNPPYESPAYLEEEEVLLAGEDTPEPERDEKEEDLKEFISSNEIEAQKQEEEESGKSETVSESEFSWNLHEFPTPNSKKSEEVEFNWNLEEFGKPETKAVSEPIFEEELFQEIREDSSRIKEQNIDRFFTFSSKNEEFQKLLDQEYEKFNMRSGPIGGQENESGIPEALLGQEISDEAEVPEDAYYEETLLDTEVPVVDEQPIDEEESLMEMVAEAEKMPADKRAAEHISEMAMARAQFFGGELILDNEQSESVERSESEAQKVSVEQKEFEEQKESEDLNAFTESEKVSGEPERASTSAGSEPEEEGKRKPSVAQILLVILSIILAIEIIILGIRFFAPESEASRAISKGQAQIFNTISGWFDGAEDQSEDGTKEDEGSPDGSDKDTKDSSDQEDKSAGGQTADGKQNAPAPDPNPAADKDALVTSQLANNKNIQQVKANGALVYQEGKDYGLSDLNRSKPIKNNIWLVPENGDPVYYDRAVVGTIIAFDSQWIDYVNGGSKDVIELLKKDSTAYKNAVSFSKIGKIKETFKLLEIGEIRQGEKGFYVWAHEELQITENGSTADKKYNWIYYLEPVDGKMQIVNYFKF